MDMNDIFEKAKDSLDAALKITEETAVISRLRFRLAGIEAKLSKAYEQLGRECYNAMQNDDNNATVLKIKELKDELCAIKKEIANLKNMND